jgi:tetratricopeptide (TPR) repeat protein
MTIWSTEIKELETLLPSIKDRFPELEKDIEHLIKTDDENVALLYSRRCLEIIVTDLCENELKRPRKTEPLKGIIDKLNREGKVPSHIITSMDHLNSLSTFGTHPKDFDPEQVKPVLINLAIVIRWYLKYKEEKEKAKAKAEEGRSSGLGHDIHQDMVPGSRLQGVESQEGRQAEIDVQFKGYKETGPVFKTRKNPFIVVSGILIFIIILLLIFDPFHFLRKDKFEDIRDPEGKISIAVMPFENLTGDTTLNWFQRGISSLIINGLGNSSELAVRDDHTMFEVMESMNQVYTAGISPSVAKEIAEKVKAETYISGSFQGREDTYWILVNLVSTETGNIIWTDKVEGNLKSSGYLDLADSLCTEIKNYLEIKALESIADYDFREVYPKSAEAYRYFIEGMNLVLAQNYESGIQSLKKALEIDSTFTLASFYIAYAYCYGNPYEQAVLWTKKTYPHKDRVPPKYQLWIELWYACYVSRNLQDVNRYCDLLAESGINTRLFWSDLGITYVDFLGQYDKAILAFEKVMDISMERGDNWEFVHFWDRFLWALHKTGNHEREKEVAEIGLNVIPANSNWILYHMAICALSQGKIKEADEILVKYKAKHKELGSSEAQMEFYLGDMYEAANLMDEAEMHFRKLYQMDPQRPGRIYNLARFLIENDINIDEGMELVGKGLEIQPNHSGLLQTKGWGLYKQGKYEESVKLLSEVWDKSGFYTPLHNQLQEAKQALANQKN